MKDAGASFFMVALHNHTLDEINKYTGGEQGPKAGQGARIPLVPVCVCVCCAGRAEEMHGVIMPVT